MCFLSSGDASEAQYEFPLTQMRFGSVCLQSKLLQNFCIDKHKLSAENVIFFLFNFASSFIRVL